MQLTRKRISITAGETYEVLSLPENFARCLWGRASALCPAGADWTVDTAEGRVKLCLSERNSFGVLDYSLIRPDGMTVYIPLRVVASGEGCELILTLFHPANADRGMRELLGAKQFVEEYV